MAGYTTTVECRLCGEREQWISAPKYGYQEVCDLCENRIVKSVTSKMRLEEFIRKYYSD